MKQGAASLAFRFVLIIGIVNLFADMTYEGARSIAGPFLGSLGAGATAVGFVAGLGELMGYGAAGTCASMVNILRWSGPSSLIST